MVHSPCTLRATQCPLLQFSFSLRPSVSLLVVSCSLAYEKGDKIPQIVAFLSSPKTKRVASNHCHQLRCIVRVREYVVPLFLLRMMIIFTFAPPPPFDQVLLYAYSRVEWRALLLTPAKDACRLLDNYLHTHVCTLLLCIRVVVDIRFPLTLLTLVCSSVRIGNKPKQVLESIKIIWVCIEYAYYELVLFMDGYYAYAQYSTSYA